MKKILFLDLDHTIIETKSGAEFPKNYDDWKLRPRVVNIMRRRQKEGFLIILVSNQAGMEYGYVNPSKFSDKLDRIQEAMNIYFDGIFIAETKDSPFRKPLFHALEAKLLSNGIKIDKSSSIMIGDAGGRKDDFSDSDKVFAKNLGIRFIHANPVTRN